MSSMFQTILGGIKDVLSKGKERIASVSLLATPLLT